MQAGNMEEKEKAAAAAAVEEEASNGPSPPLAGAAAAGEDDERRRQQQQLRRDAWLSLLKMVGLASAISLVLAGLFTVYHKINPFTAIAVGLAGMAGFSWLVPPFLVQSLTAKLLKTEHATRVKLLDIRSTSEFVRGRRGKTDHVRYHHTGTYRVGAKVYRYDNDVSYLPIPRDDPTVLVLRRYPDTIYRGADDPSPKVVAAVYFCVPFAAMSAQLLVHNGVVPLILSAANARHQHRQGNAAAIVTASLVAALALTWSSVLLMFYLRLAWNQYDGRLRPKIESLREILSAADAVACPEEDKGGGDGEGDDNDGAQDQEKQDCYHSFA